MPKNKILEGFRKAYLTIKVFPFIYTAALLITSPLEVWLSLKWAELFGLFVFTSAPSVYLLWRLSRAVRLCSWHRAQCALMLLPVAIPLCRIFWPEVNIVWVWSGVTAILIASLINAYFVFIKPSVRN